MTASQARDAARVAEGPAAEQQPCRTVPLTGFPRMGVKWVAYKRRGGYSAQNKCKSSKGKMSHVSQAARPSSGLSGRQLGRSRPERGRRPAGGGQRTALRMQGHEGIPPTRGESAQAEPAVRDEN